MFDRDYQNPYIRLNRLHVTRENIIPNLDREGVPTEIDLLSIDIDGMDYHIFDQIAQRVNARVVVIEVNRDHITRDDFDFANPPDFFPDYAGQYRWKGGSDQLNTSPVAMTKLAQSTQHV